MAQHKTADDVNDLQGSDDDMLEPGARITPGLLLAMAYAWSNLSKDQLVSAGVIGNGPGGSDWKRFNDDPMMFIMKLPPQRLPALCKLLD